MFLKTVFQVWTDCVTLSELQQWCVVATGSWSTWSSPGWLAQQQGWPRSQGASDRTLEHTQVRQTECTVKGVGGKARLGVILIYISGIFYFPDLYSCQYRNSLGFKYLNVSKTVHRCSGLSG